MIKWPAVVITLLICLTVSWVTTVNEARLFFLDLKPIIEEVTEQNILLQTQNALLLQQNSYLKVYINENAPHAPAPDTDHSA